MINARAATIITLAFALSACSASVEVHAHVEVEGATAAGLVVTYRDEQVVTNDDGAFDLPGPLPVLVTISGAGVTPPSMSVLVRSEADASFHFEAVGRVTGVLVRSGLPTGNSDLALTMTGAPHARGSIDEAGAFEFVDVPAGSHLLLASAAGYQTFVSSPFTVARAQTTDLGRGQLEPGALGPAGDLVGRVQDAASDDASGVEVLVEGTKLSTRTDADGRFRITSVPQGAYTLRFTHHGFVQRVEQVLALQGREGSLATPALVPLASLTWPLQHADHRVTVKYGASVCSIDAGRVSWLADQESGWFSSDGGRQQVRALTSSYNYNCPKLTHDGRLVWLSAEGTLTTNLPDAGSQPLVSPGYTVTDFWQSEDDRFAVQGYLPGSNEPVCFELALDGGVQVRERYSATRHPMGNPQWYNDVFYTGTYGDEPSQLVGWLPDGATALVQSSPNLSFTIVRGARDYLTVAGNSYNDTSVFDPSTQALITTVPGYLLAIDPPYLLSLTYLGFGVETVVQLNVDTHQTRSFDLPLNSSPGRVLCQTPQGLFTDDGASVLRVDADGTMVRWKHAYDYQHSARCLGDGAIWTDTNADGTQSLVRVDRDEPVARELVRDDLTFSPHAGTLNTLNVEAWAALIDQHGEFWFRTRAGELKVAQINDGGLTTIAHGVTSAHLSPDHTRLAVSTLTADQQLILQVMHRDGSHIHTFIKVGSGQLDEFTWLDDTQLLASISNSLPGQSGLWVIQTND